MIAKCIEPVLQIPLTVILGSADECVSWYAKRKITTDISELHQGKAQAITHNDCPELVVWFLYTDDHDWLTDKTIVHECFHLFVFTNSLMYGIADIVIIDSYLHENSAYHFANIYEIVSDAVEAMKAKIEKKKGK